MIPIEQLSVPFVFLYAEIHYRFFSLFPSLLFKREPETLFDVPHRLGPDHDLPVLLILNDINRFPAEPQEVAITVSHALSGTRLFRFNELSPFEIEHPMMKWQRSFVFTISRTEIPVGQLFINATVTMKSSKKKWTVFNDNLPSSTKRSFSCFHADTTLPGSELCTYGDIHLHTQYSQSHVEFGPPLKVIDTMANASGLDFIGITDHSYDLACSKDNYLIENQDVEKWKLQKEELSDSTRFSTILLHGEEVSCGNADGKTVHCGILGIHDFIPGSADGARRKLHFKRQLTINEVVTAAQLQGGISFAAHPGSRGGLLQRIALHRGEWTEKDFSTGTTAFQNLNSGFYKPSWKRGKMLWLKLLQKGKRLPLVAGNDAHGDFSRYRAIGTPFLRIHEDFQRFMGYGKTGIYAKCANEKEILENIRSGRTFITTGPYIAITYSDQPQASSISSIPITMEGKKLVIHIQSTPEFGRIDSVALFAGSPDTIDSERQVFVNSFKKLSYEEYIPIDSSCYSSGEYLRAEVETSREDGNRETGLTSPCYIE